MKKAILAAAILTASSSAFAGVAGDYASAAVYNLKLARLYSQQQAYGFTTAFTTGARSQLAAAVNLTGNSQCAYARQRVGDVTRLLQTFNAGNAFTLWPNVTGMLNDAIGEAQRCQSQIGNQ